MRAPVMSSTWLHEEAMSMADAARAVADEPELSRHLFAAAATLEGMALERVPPTRPRTRRVLGESRDALRELAGEPPP